jgi:hypothetical protein
LPISCNEEAEELEAADKGSKLPASKREKEELKGKEVSSSSLQTLKMFAYDIL